jgi:hypothetical protein
MLLIHQCDSPTPRSPDGYRLFEADDRDAAGGGRGARLGGDWRSPLEGREDGGTEGAHGQRLRLGQAGVEAAVTQHHVHHVLDPAAA